MEPILVNIEAKLRGEDDFPFEGFQGFTY